MPVHIAVIDMQPAFIERLPITKRRSLVKAVSDLAHFALETWVLDFFMIYDEPILKHLFPAREFNTYYKDLSSAFSNHEFSQTLRYNDTLILCGLYANACVLASLESAIDSPQNLTIITAKDLVEFTPGIGRAAEKSIWNSYLENAVVYDNHLNLLQALS